MVEAQRRWRETCNNNGEGIYRKGKLYQRGKKMMRIIQGISMNINYDKQ